MFSEVKESDRYESCGSTLKEDVRRRVTPRKLSVQRKQGIPRGLTSTSGGSFSLRPRVSGAYASSAMPFSRQKPTMSLCWLYGCSSICARAKKPLRVDSPGSKLTSNPLSGRNGDQKPAQNCKVLKSRTFLLKAI